MPKRTDGISMRCPDGPLDPLRMWRNRIEARMLEQAGVDLKLEQAEGVYGLWGNNVRT